MEDDDEGTWLPLTSGLHGFTDTEGNDFVELGSLISVLHDMSAFIDAHDHAAQNNVATPGDALRWAAHTLQSIRDVPGKSTYGSPN